MSRPLRVFHSVTGTGGPGAGPSAWSMATRDPPLHLRPYVEACYGYRERTPGLLVRTELPGPRAVLIIELDAPIRVHDGATMSRFPGGFVAGLDDRPTRTEHDGLQRGIQVSLTPQGARRLFGLPMSELTSRVVPLDDLWPGLRLAERLHALPSWLARFDLLEDVLTARVAASEPDHEVVAWGVRRIVGAGGALDMRTLARELGYSPKHVIALFHEHVGLPPKRLARIVRFDRLLARLKRGDTTPWAELAAQLGYYDQAHLAREVRQLSGMTPTVLRSTVIDPLVAL